MADQYGYDPLTSNMNDPIFGGQVTSNGPDTSAMAAQGADLSQPISGVQLPPLLPAPTFSEKLLGAAQAVAAAGQGGANLGEQLAAGLGGYHNVVQEGYARQNQNYLDRMGEYDMLGRIRERQMTEAAAARRMTALSKIQQDHPEMGDLLALDPDAAAKVIAQRFAPAKETVVPAGSSLYTTSPGQDPKLVSGGSSAPPPVDQTGAPLQGQDFAGWLQQNAPQRLEDAKMAIAGTYPEMTPSNRNNYIQVMRDAHTLAPNDFNPANYTVRKKVMEDTAPSGKTGQTITSIGAAAGHLASAMDNFAAMHNGNTAFGNSIKNYVDSKVGSPVGAARNAFKSDITNFATEKAKIISGSNEASDSARDAAAEPFNENSPPQNIQGSFKTSAGQIASKIASMYQSYGGTVGKHGSLYESEQFSPETKATFKNLGFDLDKIKQDSFNNAIGQPAAVPAAPAAPAAGPVISGAPSPAPAAKPQPTPAQLQYTAKKYGMTVEQVKAKLGIQ